MPGNDGFRWAACIILQVTIFSLSLSCSLSCSNICPLSVLSLKEKIVFLHLWLYLWTHVASYRQIHKCTQPAINSEMKGMNPQSSKWQVLTPKWVGLWKSPPPGVCQEKFSMGVSTADLSQIAMTPGNSLSYSTFCLLQLQHKSLALHWKGTSSSNRNKLGQKNQLNGKMIYMLNRGKGASYTI